MGDFQHLKDSIRAKKHYARESVFPEDVEVSAELQLAYRNVFFGTPDGEIVLKDLGRRLGFGSKIDDMRFAISHNLYVEILYLCGFTMDDVFSFLRSPNGIGT